MINPDNIVVDIDEQIDWLMEHKAAKGLSWPMIAASTGVAAGTLSAFGTRNYGGDRQKLAGKVFRYRQMLQTQEQREVGLLSNTRYFETRTAARLRGLMTIAHGGRMTVAATSPGTGKTMAIHEYAQSASNVWVVTMRVSVRTTTALSKLTLRAIGAGVTGGWDAQLSEMVSERTSGRRGLLIIDEANHLTFDQFEEVRSWHDRPNGPGVFFAGNEELMARIESGQRSDAFARLHSRIASSHVQTLPLEDDVIAFCDAWKIEDVQMRGLLTKIALTPAAGGLREIAQIVEQASMIAADEQRPLSYADLREAKATRVTRNIH